MAKFHLLLIYTDHMFFSPFKQARYENALFVRRCCHLLTVFEDMKKTFISIIFTTEAQAFPEYIEEAQNHK